MSQFESLIIGEIAEDTNVDYDGTTIQAIGGAVGHNPISIMIPCHRVVGADGSLTGYAGGLSRKQCLLSLEKADLPSCRAAVLAK